jgi:cellobiose dehydrogenase (acceptor)
VAARAQCAQVSSTDTYDYIVVGSGAGGIPMADRLSEAGHKVLLIEKGPPSTGRWGGTMKPNWLTNTNLTRFDVPGLCNEIWADPTGIVCTDVDQMAGCVLGGGTAVNSGLWWKPHPDDWDVNFPDGWRSKDVAAATDRVFSRIPGTICPSMDGKWYYPQGFDMLGGSLKAAGWNYIVPNDHPDMKNRTYGHSTFMFSGGERGGPLATYLATASSRKNFTLWTNTIAKRVVRQGGHATGVEVECNGAGHAGVVSLTPNTGRVIISAGAFGSAKLLFRSKAPLPPHPNSHLAVGRANAHKSALALGVLVTDGDQCRWYRTDGPAEHRQELDRWADHDLIRPVDQLASRLQSE